MPTTLVPSALALAAWFFGSTGIEAPVLGAASPVFGVFTVAPGGGLNLNCCASGTAKLMSWNATRTAGSLAFLAYTSTRSGMCVLASIASRT